jgi:hypothetical protein
MNPNNSTLDITGFISALVCAVHCSIVPILVTGGLLNSNHWVCNGILDFIVVGIGVFIAFFALEREYKHHKSLWPFTLASLGFVLLAYGLYVHNTGSHSIASIFGGAFLAIAHIVNFLLCKRAH